MCAGGLYYDVMVYVNNEDGMRKKKMREKDVLVHVTGYIIKHFF
jgi:hypothetical protein